MLGATLLAVTLVPVLCSLLGGRMHGEGAHPVLRPLTWSSPAVAVRRCDNAHAERRRSGVCGSGRAYQHWPGIYASSTSDLMFMPVTDPAIALTQAIEITQKQNAALQQFP